MQRAGLWDSLQPKLVLGENASQAMQFAASGSSQGGIVPLSLSKAGEIARLGSFALIPAEWHAAEPLRQRMALTKKAGETARAFEAFEPEVLEAAKCCGLSAWQSFVRIELPLAWPGILSAGVMTFAHTLGEFGVVLMVGGNIPGETQTVAIAIYGRVQSFDHGSAGAIEQGDGRPRLRWGPHRLAIGKGERPERPCRFAVLPQNVLLIRPDKPWGSHLENPIDGRVVETLLLGPEAAIWIEPAGLANACKCACPPEHSSAMRWPPAMPSGSVCGRRT